MYRVKIKRSAEKEIKGLPKKKQARIGAAVDLLAETPRPPKCVQLQKDRYRVRVGDYRIIYDVLDDELIVYVVRIGHRKDVYR